MSIRAPLSRRTLLRGASGAALALPFLEAMRPRAARAAGKPIRRVGFYFTGSGFDPPAWRPSGQNESFTLSETLKPFEPIKQDCLFIDGVPYASTKHPLARGIAHPGGAAAALTGSYCTNPGDGASGVSENESVDNAIARAVGKETKFPAYYFGVIPSRKNIFFAGRNQPIHPNPDPWDIYARMFSDLPAAPAPGVAAAASDPRVAGRKAVLDAVLGEYKALRCTLGQEDRARLDLHAESLAEIERRLGVRGGGASAGCEQPRLPAKLDAMDYRNAQTIVKLQADLIVMALACDLTRVFGLQWHGQGATSTPPMVYSWLSPVTTGFHNISHLRGPDPKGAIRAVTQYNGQQLVYLAQKLKTLPDGEGGTLLDSTAILWVSEIGTGWTHSHTDVVYTLVGGRKYFKTGRYLRYPGGEANAHNRLLLHLMHFMGVPAQTFGEPMYCAGGPLPGLIV